MTITTNTLHTVTSPFAYSCRKRKQNPDDDLRLTVWNSIITLVLRTQCARRKIESILRPMAETRPQDRLIYSAIWAVIINNRVIFFIDAHVISSVVYLLQELVRLQNDIIYLFSSHCDTLYAWIIRRYQIRFFWKVTRTATWTTSVHHYISMFRWNYFA